MSGKKLIEGLCECGAALADGGVVGVYCSNPQCPVEKKLVTQVAEAFRARRAVVSDQQKPTPRYERFAEEYFESRPQMESTARVSIRLFANWLEGRITAAQKAPPVTHEEIVADMKILRHTLGVGSHIHKRDWGHRNYFNAEPGHHAYSSLLRLQASGLLKQGSRPDYFHATEAGCKAIGLTPAQIKKVFAP